MCVSFDQSAYSFVYYCNLYTHTQILGDGSSKQSISVNQNRSNQLPISNDPFRFFSLLKLTGTDTEVMLNFVFNNPLTKALLF